MVLTCHYAIMVQRNKLMLLFIYYIYKQDNNSVSASKKQSDHVCHIKLYKSILLKYMTVNVANSELATEQYHKERHEDDNI